MYHTIRIRFLVYSSCYIFWLEFTGQTFQLKLKRLFRTLVFYVFSLKLKWKYSIQDIYFCYSTFSFYIFIIRKSFWKWNKKLENISKNCNPINSTMHLYTNCIIEKVHICSYICTSRNPKKLKFKKMNATKLWETIR